MSESFRFEIGPFVYSIHVVFRLLNDVYQLSLNLDIHLANTKLDDVLVGLSYVKLFSRKFK